MKLARWLIGISCAVGIVSADSKVFSHGCARYRLLYDRPVFVVRITAARRYAASSVDFKAFVQGTRIKGASRPRRRALPCRKVIVLPS